MKTLRFYWSWFKMARCYRALDKELERLERLSLLLAWTNAAAGPSISDEAGMFLASLDRVNPKSDGDGS